MEEVSEGLPYGHARLEPNRCCSVKIAHSYFFLRVENIWTAVDLYSKAVGELENGISYSGYATGKLI